MIKKVFFGDEAMLALKKSKGELVVSGRLRYVEIDGKMVLEFKPYNRQPRKKPLILTNGWIKMGRRHVGVYAAVSSKLSPEDIVEELKRDVCDGLDKVLEDGTIEEMKEYFNLLKKKEG